MITLEKKQTSELEWTHLLVKISDIRLLHKLYVLYVEMDDGPDVSVFVNRIILEDRLNGYFLGRPYSREDVLGLKWNMYLTKGYFIKIDSAGKIERFEQEDKSRYFVSFLEVSGPLGEFSSVYKTEFNARKL
jgi:hypothetical protein